MKSKEEKEEIKQRIRETDDKLCELDKEIDTKTASVSKIQEKLGHKAAIPNITISEETDEESKRIYIKPSLSIIFDSKIVELAVANTQLETDAGREDANIATTDPTTSQSGTDVTT